MFAVTRQTSSSVETLPDVTQVSPSVESILFDPSLPLLKISSVRSQATLAVFSWPRRTPPLEQETPALCLSDNGQAYFSVLWGNPRLSRGKRLLWEVPFAKQSPTQSNSFAFFAALTWEDQRGLIPWGGGWGEGLLLPEAELRASPLLLNTNKRLNSRELI